MSPAARRLALEAVAEGQATVFAEGAGGDFNTGRTLPAFVFILVNAAGNVFGIFGAESGFYE